MISVIAHRGASTTYPENTLEAFAEAVRQGADGVELDVRRSADGALVVHHDPVSAGGRPVAETPVPELPAWVPLLGAALDACGDLFVDIEVKNLAHEPGWDPEETVAAEVAALVVERGMQDRAVVSAFTPATLDAVRAAALGVATGLLTLPASDQEEAIALAVERGYAGLHPHHAALTAEVVRRAHDAGLVVTTWTVDDPERLRAVAGMGVDAVVTNVPGLARSVL